MKQVAQSVRNGNLEIMEVPVSKPGANQVLVRTTASVLSAGTERATAEFSEKSLLGKALSRPDLVRQVLQKIKTDGIVSAAKASLSRLDMPLALGYSSAGVVIEVGNNITGVAVGDRVACAGMGYASHAETAAVPKNLFVKIPDGVSDEDAAFSTVGAIALQGLRMADLRLGEKVVVIGLGLIGLLTVQLLKASGCKVMGIDLEQAKVELAIDLGADTAATVGDSLLKAVEEFTQGRGADAVLVTAASSSNAPTELAGEISRHKGRVVFVGDVKMEIPRRTYYKKELDVRLSMSYGPGRYDHQYEEKGIDYPYAYVPFTEQRNMETFLYLVQEQKVTPAQLITHHFLLDEAQDAYKLIKGETKEHYLGVVFSYPKAPVLSRKVFLKASSSKQEGNLNVGLIGAGNYAKNMLLPIMKKMAKTGLVGIATSTGISGRHTGEKHGFSYCTTDYQELLNDANINAVIIATRHNTHADIVVQALAAGKHVFVEKPLAIHREELLRLEEAAKTAKQQVLVGFNRRFSPLAQKAKDFFQGRSQPLCMVYRINAGFIPGDHWTQDTSEGGGRIIGEVCHFIDFMQFMCDARPVSVSACGIQADGLSAEDHLSVNIRFADGSIGSIHYFANGDKAVAKEYIEIFGEGKVVQIDDFREGFFTDTGSTKQTGGRSQDKGQRTMLEVFHKAVTCGGPAPIPLTECIYTTLAAFCIIDSLRTGNTVPVTEN